MILISTFKVREGSLEDFKAYCDRLIEIIQAKEPRIIGFHGFLSEDGTDIALAVVAESPLITGDA